MIRTQTLAAMVALAVLLGACGKEPAPASNASPAKAADAAARPAEVSQAQRQFLAIEAVTASAAGDMLGVPGRVTFRPQAQSAVGSAAPGRVVAVLVQPGQIVRAGTPLLTLDSADAAAARAALDQALSRLAAAENVFRRQNEMMEKGVGLELERQEATARLQEARVELERARHAAELLGAGQGNRVTVRAPADSVVMNIRANVGAMVAPGGEALLDLGDPGHLQLVALVPESDLRRISVGQQADVDIPALAARVAARVETINPRVDPESRRVQVYLSLAGRAEGLRAGMLAQIALRTAAETGIAVPVSAVLIKDGKRRVVYVERPDGSFEAREVRTGRSREGRVAILEGLAEGDRVGARGALLLDTQAELLL